MISKSESDPISMPTRGDEFSESVVIIKKLLGHRGAGVLYIYDFDEFYVFFTGTRNKKMKSNTC